MQVSVVDINEDFKLYIQKLVEQLLATNNLNVKQINGVEVTCSDLVQYFRSYIKIFSGEKLPQPKSMLQVKIF